MKSAIVFGATGLGLLLLVLSGIWSSLFPGTSSWTEEKAANLSKMQVRMHNLAGVVNNPNAKVNLHSGTELGAAKQEFEQLKKDSAELYAEFESAHDSPQTISKILKWTGISLAAIGLIGWYAVKNS